MSCCKIVLYMYEYPDGYIEGPVFCPPKLFMVISIAYHDECSLIVKGKEWQSIVLRDKSCFDLSTYWQRSQKSTKTEHCSLN